MNHKRTLLAIALLTLIPAVFSACRFLRVAEPEDEKEVVDEVKEPEKEPEPDVVFYYDEETYDRETIASGVAFAILEQGQGPALTDEMRVSLHYTAYLEEDHTVFDSSRQRDEPISFILGRNMVIAGWEEALPNLQVGDKARLWVPYHLAYGEEGRGPIPPLADLVFDVEVLEAEMIEAPEPYDITGLDTLETDTGLQLYIVQEGYGDKPLHGNILTVHYSGYLSDGTLFDSSVQRSVPFRFVLGTGQVLRGWDEGFLELKKGAKARLIIPPHLAYGQRGAGPIPPSETLIFDVELIDISE